jgi:hypothetical protein
MSVWLAGKKGGFFGGGKSKKGGFFGHKKK